MRELPWRPARTPLWLRLVSGSLLLVMLALTLTSTVGLQLMRDHLTDRVDRQLETALKMNLTRHQTAGRPMANRLERLFGPFYAVHLDPAGNVVKVIAEPHDRARPMLPKLDSAEVPGRLGEPFSVASTAGAPGRWRVSVAILPDEGWTKVVALSMDGVDANVRQLAFIEVGVGAVALCLLGIAGYLLVRHSLGPLLAIERTAEAIAGGDLSRRVPNDDPRTETGRLGRAINGMLAQIESAFQARGISERAAMESAEQSRLSEERMRRFVADASHELRTPLTSIRGFAELYRQEGGADPQVARVLRRIEDEAVRMGLLVDDLLLLARLDQQRPIERQPVDLLSVAAEAVLDAQALAPDREIDLVRLDDADGPVTVVGDEARLRQVVGNLVNNALTHTPPGTAFQVGVGKIAEVGGEPREAHEVVALEVADRGQGLLPEDSAKVFERFYRADVSRNRAQGGSGLGLSIVAALVKAHGGSVDVRSEPGVGATFRVRLPVS
ncbi:sensor histidine kinase [Rhizohabitans arisaemae]|uniref:sensor histidine kinase n=1 Tax=Rhizohabitans arisaemae TaxID=2720610 RepID=UPI0024B0ED0A|nr:HAMP domain-containing sensor histidine kinase [Rhizohabitans arisaemae]